MSATSSSTVMVSSDTTPRQTSRQLDSEIAILRGELGTLVSELDRRGHGFFGVRRWARAHSLRIGLTLVAAASGVTWLAIRRFRANGGRSSKHD